MIEQRPVTVGRRLQLPEEAGERLDVIGVELRERRGHFERRELRIATDLLRDHLIHRRACLHVGAFGLLRMPAAHERRRARMLSRGVAWSVAGKLSSPLTGKAPSHAALNPSKPVNPPNSAFTIDTLPNCRTTSRCKACSLDRQNVAAYRSANGLRKLGVSR